MLNQPHQPLRAGNKMAITVLDALKAGWKNLTTGLPELGLEQIHNGIIALTNGMMPDDVIQENLDADLILTPKERTNGQN